MPRKPFPLLTAAIPILFSTILMTGCGAASALTPSSTSPTQPPASDNLQNQAAIASLSADPSQLVLAPGAHHTLHIYAITSDQKKAAVQPADIHFQSGGAEISIDPNGTITAAPDASTGDVAEITISYDNHRITVPVEVKYSLSETASTDASGDHVVNNMVDRAVLVNKQRKLPDGYVPPDLVVPHVPFSFTQMNERKYMRKEAADALEQLFAAAKNDGYQLYGVSGYRSYKTQKSLFDMYVRTQGETEAKRFSAIPGHSEHQTGLAIDVSSSDVHFNLDQSFGNTPEAKWLAEHADEYGFIIRYPQDKEAITGYAYEPWHIRYVGKQLAKEIYTNHLTLEQFFDDAQVVLARQQN
ncbi:MAG: hypothetical protein A2189_00660 [Paenibacillus sp. RIFOXYA1_FULL_44_5]|nr:MAG: hypothetical protein A2189_00660 [Paenibacillus sp. RIFOXYA1_FULL_44_5]